MPRCERVIARRLTGPEGANDETAFSTGEAHELKRRSSSLGRGRVVIAKTKHHRGGTKPKRTRRWSARVTRESNALDLDRDVFTWKDPKRIARSLKRSAEHSRRRKSEPYRSAMSMLTFYVNRAGKNLSPARRRVLERAKTELKHAFGRD